MNAIVSDLSTVTSLMWRSLFGGGVFTQVCFLTSIIKRQEERSGRLFSSIMDFDAFAMFNVMSFPFRCKGDVPCFGRGSGWGKLC